MDIIMGIRFILLLHTQKQLGALANNEHLLNQSLLEIRLDSYQTLDFDLFSVDIW